jgi:hypothetical protein
MASSVVSLTSSFRFHGIYPRLNDSVGQAPHFFTAFCFPQFTPPGRGCVLNSFFHYLLNPYGVPIHSSLSFPRISSGATNILPLRGWLSKEPTFFHLADWQHPNRPEDIRYKLILLKQQLK